MKQPRRLDTDGVPETALVGHPQVWGEPRHESQDSAGKALGPASRNRMLERATLEPADPKGPLEDYLHRRDFRKAQVYRDQKGASYQLTLKTGKRHPGRTMPGLSQQI
jgi:hypothetical protein